MLICQRELSIHRSEYFPPNELSGHLTKRVCRIIDEFHGRGWMPLEPKLLNYENTQFLIIGHKNHALEKTAEPQDGEDQKADKETPMEELEKLEQEDEIRVEHLKGK